MRSGWRAPLCGGVIRTDRVGGFVIDAGPDTLLTHKPAALALVRELGLAESLVAPLPRRTTYVVRRKTLRTLPETSAMGLPTSWQTLVSSRFIPQLELWNMAPHAPQYCIRRPGDSMASSVPPKMKPHRQCARQDSNLRPAV